MGGVIQRVGSRLSRSLDLTGRFPGLQPQPPLVALTDPANLAPNAPPAVQAAAEIKAEEDAAAQKIMAIRYLATIGCGGCYDKVEQALLEGMSDCTEDVRYEAVRALECRPDSGCRYCSSASCCSPPVRKKLEELSTCDHEPSARVNRAARLALACCMGKPLEVDAIPREGPPGPTPAPAVVDAFSILTPENGLAAAPSNNDPVASLFAQAQGALYGGNQQSGNAQASAASDRVLALVNDDAITSSQLLAMLDTQPEWANEDLRQREQRMLVGMRRLIDLKLIEQLARQERNQVMPAVGIHAASNMVSPAELQNWLERELAVDTYVSPNELMAYYAVQQQRFTLPARARWETLTIHTNRCSSSQHASEVATFIKSRAEGVEVVAPEGFAPSLIEAEVVAWQELNRLESTLQQVLASLEPGRVSHPLQQGDNLQLIRLLEREPVRLTPINAVANQLIDEIVQQRRQATLERFLAQARANARIWNSLEIGNGLPLVP